MLIESVVSSKSIALAATEDASNKIPYLGLGFFPAQAQEGIDLKWIKTHKGLSPILAPSNFDALPVIRGREGITIEKTEMPFFRESMFVSERDMVEIERVEKESDPYLVQALRNIYDDTNNLVESARVVPEIMRMQLLAAPNGKPSISIAADGVSYVYDYDPSNSYASNNYETLSGTSAWSDATNSTPLDDINEAKRTLAANGSAPRYIIMTSKTWGYLMASKQVESVLLTTNAAGTIYKTDAAVKTAIREATGLDVIVYDKCYKGADGTATNFYPDDQVTLVPEGNLGKTFFGTTPEARSARQVAGVDVTVIESGIAVATKASYGPPYKFETTASEIVLPSYERMDETFVIKVASGVSA